jgi:hypothetical protein
MDQIRPKCIKKVSIYPGRDQMEVGVIRTYMGGSAEYYDDTCEYYYYQTSFKCFVCHNSMDERDAIFHQYGAGSVRQACTEKNKKGSGYWW